MSNQNYRDTIKMQADNMYDCGVSVLVATKFFKDISKHLCELFDAKEICQNTLFDTDEFRVKVFHDLMVNYLRHFDSFLADNFYINR